MRTCRDNCEITEIFPKRPAPNWIVSPTWLGDDPVQVRFSVSIRESLQATTVVLQKPE